MPQRHKLKSLRSLCMWEIMKNMGIYTNEELQNLRTDLAEELIQLYNQEFLQHEKDKKKMEYYFRTTYRNRLIKPTIKKLNLPFPDNREFFHETLMVVLKTCKNLTHFSCNFREQSRQHLYQLVISIPNIIELKLVMSCGEDEYEALEYDDDDILEAIGNNCFQLEILHLTKSRVTTHGLRRFCRSKSSGAKIKELNLDESRVEVNGCLAALLNLKQMKRFYCGDFILRALRKLHQDSYKSPVPSFQLCELPIMYDNYIPTGFFSFVAKCCPNIRTLHLHTSGSNFNHHKLKELKSCYENGCLYLDVVDVDNFMPDLIYFGSRVTKLSFRECDVHLPTIGFTCPNLTDLTMWGVKYIHVNYVARSNSVVAYSKLLTLNLSSQNSSPIPIQQLQYLLGNCVDLQTLKIEYNNEFTDDIMCRILQGVNPLRRLTHFELNYCNVVSSITISQLLQADNELTRLTVNHCKKIKENERLQIELLIKENNFCVTLEVKNNVSDVESDDESDEESDEESDDESDDG